MKHLMNSAEIESDANGTHVTLVLQLRTEHRAGLTSVPARPAT